MVFSSIGAGSRNHPAESTALQTDAVKLVTSQLREIEERLTRELPRARADLASAEAFSKRGGLSSSAIDDELDTLSREYNRISSLLALPPPVVRVPLIQRTAELDERSALLVRQIGDYLQYPALRGEAKHQILERKWPSSPREGQELDLLTYLVDLADKQYARGDIASLSILSYGIRAQVDALETGFRPYVIVGAAAIARATGYGPVKLQVKGAAARDT